MFDRTPEPFLTRPFWAVAFGARLEVFLPRCFELWAPGLVEYELVAASRQASGATYPYAEGFRLWHEHGLVVVADPQADWPLDWGARRFAGKGEEASIRLASEMGAVVPVNERPAWEFALMHGLAAMNVPAFVVYLAQARLITIGTGLEALATIERGNRTTRVFVGGARALLQRLWRRRTMAEELITKSVRLNPAESAAVAELAARLHCSEGSLLRRFVAEGLREAQLGEGILAYVRGQALLPQAAAIAHISEPEFSEQLRLRGIVGPGALQGEGEGDVNLFLTSLRRIAEALDNPRLREAVERLQVSEDKVGSSRV